MSINMNIFKAKIVYVVIFSICIGLGIIFLMEKSNKPKESTQTVKAKEPELANRGRARVIPVTYINILASDLDVYKKSLGSVYNFNSLSVPSEVEGMVSSISAEIGDTVKAGQTLATVDNRQLLNNQKSQNSEVRRLEDQLKERIKTLDRYEKLHKDGYASDSELGDIRSQVFTLKEQITNAKANLDNITIKIQKSVIKAPISGIIQKRSVSKGDFLNVGKLLFEIVDNSKLVVIASFPEDEARFFKKGQKVKIKSASLESEIVARVKEITPLVDDKSLSVQLIIELDNKNNLLKPGSVVEVFVLVEEKQNVILVPEEAIIFRYSGRVVYIVDETGSKSIEKPVVIGHRENSMIEVLEGLNVGDKLIMDGSGFLSDNTVISSKEITK